MRSRVAWTSSVEVLVHALAVPRTRWARGAQWSALADVQNGDPQFASDRKGGYMGLLGRDRQASVGPSLARCSAGRDDRLDSAVLATGPSVTNGGVMLRRLVWTSVVISSLVLGASVARADGEHHGKMHEACKADMEKFCKDTVGDRKARRKCMQDHEKDLSEACKKAREERRGHEHKGGGN